MANILSENFTGTDNTDINGFNGWTASSNGLDIKSNKAAKTDNGSVWAYKSATGWTGARTASAVFSRYTNTGARFFNQFILGSSNISSLANFQNNSMYFYFFRSDHNATNTGIYIYDGTTVVASKTTGFAFQLDGSDMTITVTMNSDGSGQVEMVQNGVSQVVSWTARTWTYGTGDYHGFYFDHSGTDGTGRLTRSQVDTISIDTTGGGGPTFIPKTVMID